jgi:hypothetical protein
MAARGKNNNNFARLLLLTEIAALEARNSAPKELYSVKIPEMARSTRQSLLASLAFRCLVGANSFSFLSHEALLRRNPFSPAGTGSRLARPSSTIIPETEESYSTDLPLKDSFAEDVLVSNDSDQTMVLADADDFVKPDRDLREYRVIVLPNNLQVLLVSDQMAEGDVGVEAASVHVQAGHFDDSVKGLAHFHVS